MSTHAGNPQFDSASALFGHQQSTTATGAVDPKLQYASDLSVPLLYTVKTAAKMAGQDCKLQVPAEETSLLQQATAARRKSLYDDTVAVTPNTETLLGGRRPVVIMSESQNVENGMSSIHSTPAESIDQNISLVGTVSKASALMQERSDLIYSNPQRGAVSSLLPASAHSTETGVLDSLSKGNNTVGIVGGVHDSPLLSPSLLGDQMLPVTQTSIIASAHNARLDALITSAMNSHVLSPDNNIHASNTDKLDALVNSAVVSHMIPAAVTAADSIMLNNSVQSPLRQQTAASTDHMSQVPVKKITGTGLGNFDILPAQHSNTETSQNTHLMSSAMSVALNEHLLVTPTKAQVQAGAQLSTSAPPSSPENALYTSHDQTSALTKNLILSPSVATTAESQILVASPTRVSPVSVKSMVLESPDTLAHNEILASNSTSPTAPIVVKQMVTAMSSEGQMLIASPTSAPIENIMDSSVTQQGNSQMILTGPTCTSPVAMKTMIFESAASEQCLANPAHTSPIAVKTMILKPQLSGSVDESLMPRTTAQSTHMSTENARLDALVQSTLSGHAFVSSEPQVTSGLDVHTGNGMGVMSQQAHMPQSSQVPSASPLISHPPACITTLITQSSSEPSSHLPVPAVTTDGALMNTIFTTSRSNTDTNSSLQAHSFNKEGTVVVGTDSQTPCCTNGSALPHGSQFTTASSNSGGLVTGITMPSKMAEELAAQSRDSSSGYVTQMLLGLAADEKIKKDSEVALMSRDKIKESLQQQADFSESKLPETRLFGASQMLKATVGDLLKSAITDVPNLHGQSQVTTMSDLLITKQSQEVQEQQCRQRQQHSVTSQTTTCVTMSTATTAAQPQKKGEEGMVPQELTQMSENDLLSYINPSAFDQG
jgi:hypothetical protein